MAYGLVYILTNPCLDGWVKIGMTSKNDVKERLSQLNSPSNIPLSYKCYATYEVENPLGVEQSVHRLIDKVNLTLHARETLSNGKIREREFFKLSPEVAFDILKEVATLRGDLGNLKHYDSDDIQLIEDINQIIGDNQVEETITSTNPKTVNIENTNIGKRIEFRKERRRISRIKSVIPESLYKFI